MKNLIVIFLLLYVLITYGYSQCSDAGVCIIGKKPLDILRENNSSVTLSYIYGRSGEDNALSLQENDLTFNSVKLDADLTIFTGSTISLSLPYTFVSGPLGSTNGPGDLIAIYTKTFALENMHLLSFNIGAKFATGSVNLGDSLPQSYQPGLGTNDLLLGAGYTAFNFSALVAYQKPFGRSANNVTRLKRGDDIFVRLSYSQRFKIVNVKGEVLVIKRIQKSSVLNSIGTTENYIEVDDSNPLQVNILGQVTYFFSRKLSVYGMAAVPLLKRDSNIDGLKRSLTLSAAISYLFGIK